MTTRNIPYYRPDDWLSLPPSDQGDTTKHGFKGIAYKAKKRLMARLDSNIEPCNNLTKSERGIAKLIVWLYNPTLGYSYPNIETLAGQCGCSTKTVKRAITKLHELGLVYRISGRDQPWQRGDVTNKGRNNKYLPHFELGTPYFAYLQHKKSKAA